MSQYGNSHEFEFLSKNVFACTYQMHDDNEIEAVISREMDQKVEAILLFFNLLTHLYLD